MTVDTLGILPPRPAADVKASQMETADPAETNRAGSGLRGEDAQEAKADRSFRETFESTESREEIISQADDESAREPITDGYNADETGVPVENGNAAPGQDIAAAGNKLPNAAGLTALAFPLAVTVSGLEAKGVSIPSGSSGPSPESALKVGTDEPVEALASLVDRRLLTRMNATSPTTDPHPASVESTTATSLQSSTTLPLQQLDVADPSRTSASLDEQLASMTDGKASSVELTRPLATQSNVVQMASATNASAPILTTDPMTTSSQSLIALNETFGSERSITELGNRLQVMVNDGIKSARLAINPPELGQLRVNISINDTDAQVTIATTTTMARDVIDESVLRLKESFLEAGFTNVDVEVGYEGASPDDADDSPFGFESSGETEAALSEELQPGVGRVSSVGIVDRYA